VASGPLLVRGRRGNTGQTPHPISARARRHFRIPTRFPPRRRHSHPRAAARNRIFHRILFYGVGIRGFRPVESEYRALYSRFTGQKNRGSVRHALIISISISIIILYTLYHFNQRSHMPGNKHQVQFTTLKLSQSSLYNP
jgi:hypothetical protein